MSAGLDPVQQTNTSQNGRHTHTPVLYSLLSNYTHHWRKKASHLTPIINRLTICIEDCEVVLDLP